MPAIVLPATPPSIGNSPAKRRRVDCTMVLVSIDTLVQSIAVALSPLMIPRFVQKGRKFARKIMMRSKLSLPLLLLSVCVVAVAAVVVASKAVAAPAAKHGAAPAVQASSKPKQAVRLQRLTPEYWRVTFDNPPFNIFGPETIPQLNAVITLIETDPHVRVSMRPPDSVLDALLLPVPRHFSGATTQAFGGHHRQESAGAVVQQAQARGLEILCATQSLGETVDALRPG